MTELPKIGFVGFDNLFTRAYLQKSLKAGFSFGSYLLLNKKKVSFLGKLNRKLTIYKDSRSYSGQEKALSKNAAMHQKAYQKARSELLNTASHFRSPDYDPLESPLDTLKTYRIIPTCISTYSINNRPVTSVLSDSSCPWFLFSCGGSLVRKPVFATGKKLIHLHPGRVPEFRGSDCLIWSLLQGSGIGVSAFIMNEGIDAGECIKQWSIPLESLAGNPALPEVDADVRSACLVNLLSEYHKTGSFSTAPQNDSLPFSEYYKAHPWFISLAISKLK